MTQTADATGVARIFGGSRVDDPRYVRNAWLLSRLAILLAWVVMRFNLGDTRYYFTKMYEMSQVGPRLTMQEYPTPVLWFFQGLYALSFHTRWAFVLVFVLAMILVDAAFTWALWTLGRERRGEAVFYWSIFLLLVGPTAYLRFDLVTAVLAGLSLLALGRRHHIRAGGYVGLGAAIKLWPALLWPALLGGNAKQRINATLGTFGTGGVLALLSLWYAGWDRLVSPLHYQSDRGLQIESLWASPPMLWRILRRNEYIVEVSKWNAWEISGPMTQTMLKASSLSMAAGLAFVLLCYAIWLRRRHHRLTDAAALMLLVILMMMITNKTFSPQYIMWVGGPTAAAIALLPHADREDADAPDAAAHRHADVSHLRAITRWLLIVTALTTLVYPVGYAPIVHNRLGLTPMTLVLVGRNLLLGWLFWLVARWVWHTVRRSER